MLLFRFSLSACTASFNSCFIKLSSIAFVLTQGILGSHGRAAIYLEEQSEKARKK